MKLNSRIKKIRADVKLTQAQMAGRMGIAVSTYQYYERGERTPPADFLNKLATTFDIDASWLLTGKREGSVAEKRHGYGVVRKGQGDDPQLKEIMDWLRENPEEKKIIHRLMKHHQKSNALLKKLIE